MFLIAFDNWLLRCTDRAILWVWNTFEVRKIIIQRVLLGTWLLSDGISEAIPHKVRLGYVFMALFMLSLHALDEHRANWPPEQLNSWIISIREEWMLRVTRYFVLISCLIFSFSTTGETSLPEKVCSFFGYWLWFLYVMSWYGLVPTEPPHRKTQEAFDAA
jgi:hypothetical protein